MGFSLTLLFPEGRRDGNGNQTEAAAVHDRPLTRPARMTPDAVPSARRVATIASRTGRPSGTMPMLLSAELLPSLIDWRFAGGSTVPMTRAPWIALIASVGTANHPW